MKVPVKCAATIGEGIQIQFQTGDLCVCDATTETCDIGPSATAITFECNFALAICRYDHEDGTEYLNLKTVPNDILSFVNVAEVIFEGVVLANRIQHKCSWVASDGSSSTAPLKIVYDE